MRPRKRYPVALLLVLAAIALSTVFAASAAALPTFTEAIGGVGPCDTCHTLAATHAVPAHQPLITGNLCDQCHTVNTATPPSPQACASCHGGASVILAAHAGAPAPAAGCSTTVGCHGVTAGATITAITPATALAGADVTITGTGFGATRGAGNVMFGTTTATAVSWSDTSIVVTVPATLTPGPVDVVVTPDAGTASGAFSFTVGTPGADTIAPVVTFSGVVNGKWYNRSKTIVLTATDNAGGSGVASITYSINGGTPVVVMADTADVMIEVNRTTHADDGTYAVAYFATDVAGNSSTSKTVTIKIDSVSRGLPRWPTSESCGTRPCGWPTRSPTWPPTPARPR